MNGKITFRLLVVGVALLATALLVPGKALAHCDGMDGPVVKAAQRALAEGNVNFVLIWVQPGDEGTIKTAFQKTLAVRKLSPEARELADMYFFETLVRIHRAGEGAPYTGLKPAGRDLGPVIPAADKAIETGAVEPLLKILPAATHMKIRQDFAQVLTKKNYKADDIKAGREYVAAYVTFMHTMERLHGGSDSEADEHHGGKPHQHKPAGGHAHDTLGGHQHAAEETTHSESHKHSDH